METTFYPELAESLKASALMQEPAAPPASGEGDKPVIQRAKTFGQLLVETVADPYVRNKVQSNLQISLAKEIGTTDIVSLLAASVSPQMAVQRNTETKFLNVMESQSGPKPIVNDWQYRIREERIGNQRAPKFNPEGELPAQDQAIREVKYNSLMFVGGTLQQSIIAQEMAATQADVNLMASEIDHEIVRIRKAVNYYSLVGVQQNSFLPGNAPECHGFLTGSTLNVIDLGGGVDISEQDLEDQIDAIAALYGYDVQMCIITNSKQVKTVRSIEIDRYRGNQPGVNAAYQAALEARFKGFSVPVDKVFEPTIAPPIPVLHDMDMPAGTTLLFIVDFPMLAEFQLGGQSGPWSLARFTERLIQMVVCFYGWTVDDPLKSSRASIIGHR